MQRRRVRYRTYPSPSLDLEEDEDLELMTCRHITFPPDVRLQSAVQQQDNAELAKILNQHGAKLDLDSCSHVGLTALHQGVLNRNLDTVKLLLCQGANANVQDVHGYSPLHTASACGLRNIASLLIIFGADLWTRTLAGESPLDLAKDLVTADLLMTEMCRQIQHQELMERYGFAFRFIDLCERVRAHCCMAWQKVTEWVQHLLKKYCNFPDYSTQNGKVRAPGTGRKDNMKAE
ncbi:protein phosphatase 1 regulatory subunit 27-like [Acanthaster planci]|uniref:Protein phosphatase 1 regulatory subunit 27-like n=1 Tax=Acanthaster planci TaxID=133434 RepID=A0A8B7XLB8_ACAPL|nr:protein phosphatase 1 regulatory subunit 27-like [Acanthaster planci]